MIENEHPENFSYPRSFVQELEGRLRVEIDSAAYFPEFTAHPPSHPLSRPSLRSPLCREIQSDEEKMYLDVIASLESRNDEKRAAEGQQGLTQQKPDEKSKSK